MNPHSLQLGGNPADAEADFSWGSFYYFDTLSSDTHHSFAAAMGHVWVCAIYQGPLMDIPGGNQVTSTSMWAGQTSTNDSKKASAKADWKMYNAFWNGTAFWESVVGEADSYKQKIEPRTKAMFGDDGYEPQPGGGADGKMSDGKTSVVRHQWRLPPRAARAALQYITNRDFASYGLDIFSTQSAAGGTLTGPKGNAVQKSGGGCGSFVGLTLDFIGLDEHKSWWVDNNMTKGVKINQPDTVIWAASRYFARQLCQRVDTDLHASPGLQQWTGTRIKFIDPGIAGEWCLSQQAAQKPVTVKQVKDFESH